jgi:hypothetical protein
MNVGILVFRPQDQIRIGEMFVDGQSRNVWCNSNKAIIDLEMYIVPAYISDPNFATKESCYFLENANYNITLKMQFVLSIIGGECDPSYQIIDPPEFFLCE